MDHAYKALRDEWYLRLKSEGFTDIENVDSPNEWLINWDSIWFYGHVTPSEFKEIEQYYYMTRSFLESHRFQSEMEREVWRYHCDGLSCREIAKLIGCGKTTVNDITLRLIKYMRLGF